MNDSKDNDNQDAMDDDWAAAMAEQGTDSSAADEDDPWAAALAEQEEAVSAAGVEPEEPDMAADEPTAEAAEEKVFRSLDAGSDSGKPRELEMIMDIPVRLNVELGRTRLTIKQLLELTEGSVVELDGLAGDPMDILINGYLIAQGEVVVIDDKYGIRITEIITPSERVQKLNR